MRRVGSFNELFSSSSQQQQQQQQQLQLQQQNQSLKPLSNSQPTFNQLIASNSPNKQNLMHVSSQQSQQRQSQSATLLNPVSSSPSELHSLKIPCSQQQDLSMDCSEIQTPTLLLTPNTSTTNLFELLTPTADSMHNNAQYSNQQQQPQQTTQQQTQQPNFFSFPKSASSRALSSFSFASLTPSNSLSTNQLQPSHPLPSLTSSTVQLAKLASNNSQQHPQHHSLPLQQSTLQQRQQAMTQQQQQQPSQESKHQEIGNWRIETTLDLQSNSNQSMDSSFQRPLTPNPHLLSPINHFNFQPFNSASQASLHSFRHLPNAMALPTPTQSLSQTQLPLPSASPSRCVPELCVDSPHEVLISYHDKLNRLARLTQCQDRSVETVLTKAIKVLKQQRILIKRLMKQTEKDKQDKHKPNKQNKESKENTLQQQQHHLICSSGNLPFPGFDLLSSSVALICCSSDLKIISCNEVAKHMFQMLNSNTHKQRNQQQHNQATLNLLSSSTSLLIKDDISAQQQQQHLAAVIKESFSSAAATQIHTAIQTLFNSSNPQHHIFFTNLTLQQTNHNSIPHTQNYTDIEPSVDVCIFKTIPFTDNQTQQQHCQIIIFNHSKSNNRTQTQQVDSSTLEPNHHNNNNNKPIQ